MYKRVLILLAVLFMTWNQSAFGGFVAYVNYSDENCTIPVGRFIASGASCPATSEPMDCIPVPNSQFFYQEDATSFCNATTAPESPEGWYSVYLNFGATACSSKTASIIQISLMNTEISMMANIFETGLQAWNVTGSCNNETGVISARACGRPFGPSLFCPFGDFTKDCTRNEDFQAAGYQVGCNAAPVIPVSPPISPPVAAPQSSVQPIASVQNSGATMAISYLVGAAIVIASLI
eukprot:TRINITY_DN11170_c0_g1_i1.p1 TRINITY_DN11170_c0_g1~~TRINITY_DN11170_c0_g1_i1.p1  ORF type:complete len:244 (-),score=2.79 TRINITY_DN11170_c0_g1_i1:34-741(-)